MRKPIPLLSLVVLLWTATAFGQSEENPEPSNEPLEYYANKIPAVTYPLGSAYSTEMGDNNPNVTYVSMGAPETDFFGVSHERKQVYWYGYPVFGIQVIDHTEPGSSKSYRTGRTVLFNDQPPPQSFMGESAAFSVLSDWFPDTSKLNAQMVIYPTEPLRLAYQIDEDDEHWQIFIDAATSEIITANRKTDHFSNFGSGCDPNQGNGVGCSGETRCLDVQYHAGQGLYYLEDSDLLSRIHFGSLDYLVASQTKTFSDSIAVETHYNIDQTFNFYEHVFGRFGFTGSGKILPAVVHHTNPGNARFVSSSTGIQWLEFGDGNGVDFGPFGCDLEIVAHEITHGVSFSSIRFARTGEAPGLNESFSDMMGATVGFYYGNGNWTVGENTITPAISGDALRYMNNPTANCNGGFECGIDYWYNGVGDEDGHNSSGISSLAFYLATEGGIHPRSQMHPGPEVPGLGINISRQIFYTGFTQYLTSFSTFSDARHATETVAAHYGSTVKNAITRAWEAVGVGERTLFPDLILQSHTQPPQTVTSGDSLNISYTAQNIGQAGSAQSYFQVALSPDPVFNRDSDIILGSKYTPWLQENDTYATSFQVSIDAPAGPYYILFVVDGREEVVESDETNNIFVAPITVNGQGNPPLAPAYITATNNDPNYPGSIFLSWPSSSGALGYSIMRTGNGQTTEIPVGNATQYIDSNVAIGTVYTYRVRAYNDDGFSSYSSSATGSAVGSQFNPPTATFTDGENGNYEPGEVMSMRIETNPAQPNQPVYISRNLNGTQQLQNELLTLNGQTLFTNASGVLEFSHTIGEDVEGCGSFTYQRFSVGSSSNPKSSSTSFTVLCVQAPTATRPAGPFQLGGQVSLTIITNPVQRFKPVYVWRKRNGVWESSGDPLVELVDGEWVPLLTDNNGRLVRDAILPDNPLYCGAYTDEQFTVGWVNNPKSTKLSYTVTGDDCP